MKDVRTQEGKGFVQIGKFADKERGIIRCERLHFLVQKTLNFFKLMVCLHEKEGEG